MECLPKNQAGLGQLQLNEAILGDDATTSNSYDFGQASDGALSRAFSDTQFLRDVSPRASLCS
jgi:hypothetical protein